MGATGAWIQENWKFNFFSQSLVQTNYEEKWHFGGGGIRLKFENAWLLGSGFALTNAFSTGMLIGGFHYTNYSTLTSFGGGSLAPFLQPFTDSRYQNTICLPTTLFSIGINWCHEFCGFAFSTGVAGEVTTFYNLHQIYKTTTHSDVVSFADQKDARSVANVNFCGVNFNLGVGF